jgi:hypothetical protein
MIVRNHSYQIEGRGEMGDYLATWERHAAALIRGLDDDLDHDRSELFQSPLDDELALKRLMRELEAEGNRP